ncbi:MAG: geranylgeranyl reductase family protein [Actinomycetales bacterium]|nr:geranylgeranyl reductase family protein [Actinomycetales bacterium]
MTPRTADVLVVGAGPAGSAAAAWAARSGAEVTLVDAAHFPRDKPCGDGLTPRAMAELERLGLHQWCAQHTRNEGLRAAGFGQELYLPWPGGSLPRFGGAVPRLTLDARIRQAAIDAGATALDGYRAVGVTTEGGRVTRVQFTTAADPVAGTPAGRTEVNCRRLIVADGARSHLGRLLGRTWHRTTAYGVAARAYLASERSDDPWISSHLELRDEDGALLSGYGWIFPLGNGEVNLGVGTLATARRPAQVNLRGLLAHYAESQRESWRLSGEVRAPWSALLPMGGAVSGIAGRNWVLIGDAAGCVNPLNGEGIDYGLETGRLAAEVLTETTDGTIDLQHQWPQLLRHHYASAFSIARRLAGLLTVPGLLTTAGPIGMRSRALMTIALRVMGNLITDEDTDATARIWRAAGRTSIRCDQRPPFT